MNNREAEWEDIYEREAGGGKAKLRAYIERNRGSRDEVVVHTYINIDADDAAERDHGVWRFWLIDEEDQTAKYKTTRNKSEPSQLALFGLQEYGWDCLNFDMVTDDEFDDKEANTYRQLGRESLRRAGSLEDPAREDLMVELFIRCELYSALTDPDGSGNTMLDIIYGHDTDASGAALDVEVPEFVPEPEQASLSNALVNRFEQLVDDYSDTDWEVTDQRTLR